MTFGKEMKMITTKRFVIAALVVIVGIALFGVLRRVSLASHSRVTKETGLELPEGTRIVETAAHAFSLADGDNYEWLIESDKPLTHWIQSSDMRREDGDGVSWASVKNFEEVADIARDKDRGIGLDSVWKYEKGGKTSYLYVADERRVALLTTFNP
jgi:hypothetical protein